MPKPLIFRCRSMDSGRCLFSDTFRRASRPATRRPLLEKGSIRKLFCGWATYFLWKGEESGMPDPWIFGNRSMDTVRRPLCGVLCSRAWWEASSESPRVFGGCLPPCTKAQNTTEGTAHGIHRSVPENQRIRHSGFFALP